MRRRRSNPHRSLFGKSAAAQFTKSNVFFRSVQFSPFAPFVVVLRNAFDGGDQDDMMRLRKAIKAIKSAALISSGIAKLHSTCDKLLRLTEEHLLKVQQSEARVSSIDAVGDYDFVAVMEDTENMPLFMDSWETFLNLQY